MIARYSETPPQQLERMKRWRDAGWVRFTFNYFIAMALIGPVVLAWIMGFFVGYSFTFLVLSLLAPFAVMSVFTSQLVWLSLPSGIEVLEETDPVRKALWREANVITVCGGMLALLSNFIPFHIGRSAAGADLMLLISGLVVCVWGMTKIHRYWHTSPHWRTRTLWERFMRSYQTMLIFVIGSTGCLVRAYACYGDAAWGEPVRQLMY
jgi:hypothetical protein